MTGKLPAAIVSLLIAAVAILGPGPARAQDYEAGIAAYEAGDFARAIRIWDPLALNGDSTAQYSLGKIYEAGNIDVERDYGRAIEWYRLAVAQGVAAAQNNLGLMYAQGRGVARDAGRAAELWSAAAKQNHPMAQFNLGLAYFRGEGTPENKMEAESWFRRAAELGLPDAQYALGQVKLHGLTAAANKGEALAWYQLAAAQGHQKAKDQAETLRQDGVKPSLDIELDEPERAPGTLVTAAKSPSQATVPGAQIAVPKTEAPAAASAKPAFSKSVTTKPLAAPKNDSLAAASPAQIKTQIARAGAAATPAGAGGQVKVWLYSAQSEVEAIGYLRRIEDRIQPLLAGVDGAVVPVQFSEGDILYRVVAGNFETWKAGQDWCGLLTARMPGTFCKALPTARTGP